ncbi:dihydropteroate synthase [Archangium lansingense]|uniref:dihydropteroate synthase n=1 Tax=Archangium lansingense TaxID=2995310 RepID=A0ABT4AC01_9BACT|nr:dihydropteroate synthase [Archangium lansinium]MCY1079202.1 dihydropteroate synthase [Archangium lansinium]
MIRARPIRVDRPADLEPAFLRMGLPTPAREYLLEKVPALHVLLTGLEREQGRFLAGLFQASETPGREEYPSWVAGDLRSRPGTGLLFGRKEQFERVVVEAKARPELAGLAGALARVLEASAPPAPLVLGSRTFTFGTRTHVMGVVNVTPDSFSDGGRYFGTEAAVAHGLRLAEAGADVLDVGGESTRPGSPPVSAEEEAARIVPVLEGLRARTDVPLSVDTTKAAVAREALKAGAVLVNDISGFHFDSELPRVTAEAGAACCLMHIQGTPQTMQKDPHYEDVVDEVLTFLEEGVERAVAAGVPRERVLVDPGIGFGKTLGHNLFLLRRLDELRMLGLPLLVGTSRKSFLGKLVGGKPANERLAATLGSVATMAAAGNADFVRVHDVTEVKDALTVADAVRSALDGGALYQPGKVRG